MEKVEMANGTVRRTPLPTKPFWGKAVDDVVACVSSSTELPYDDARDGLNQRAI